MTTDKILNELVQTLIPTSGLSQHIAAEVYLAMDDPKNYIKLHSSELNDRGVSSPIKELPTIALLDALLKNGLAAEFDWKEEPSEMLSQFQELNKHYHLHLPETVDTNTDTEQYLKDFSRELSKQEYALAQIDIYADCYPIVFIKLNAAHVAQDLAKKCGIRITIF